MTLNANGFDNQGPVLDPDALYDKTSGMPRNWRDDPGNHVVVASEILADRRRGL
jgi:hypothetical protein